MAAKNPSPILWYFKEYYILTWKTKKEALSRSQGRAAPPLCHAPCALAASWAGEKSQEAGDSALGQAEGQDARLPTQAGSSAPWPSLPLWASISPK